MSLEGRYNRLAKQETGQKAARERHYHRGEPARERVSSRESRSGRTKVAPHARTRLQIAPYL